AAGAVPSATSVTLTTATLDLKGLSPTINALNGTGTITDNGAVATLNVGNSGGSGSFSGVIQNGTGTTGFTKTGGGTEKLSGNTPFGGLTTVSAGTLQLASATALGSTAGATTVASGAVLDLNGQTVGAENIALTGTASGGTGALINSSASLATAAGDITGFYAV